MGTAGLVIGLGLIIFGFLVIYYGFFGNTAITVEGFIQALAGSLIVGIPLIVTGGILLVKHDREKKNQRLVSPQTLKGVGIGIIASLIIWGASLAATNQIFVMTGDAMEPTIMNGDIVRYTKTPFKEISVNDIIAYTDAQDTSKVLVHKVVGVMNPVVKVKNEESPVVHNVIEDQYIGKINSIESSGALNVFMKPTTFLVLIAAAFVTPIVIMKIYGGEKSKNS